MPDPMLPANPLFTGADLTGLLHRPISDAEVVSAERVVWGRVKPLLGLDARPAVLPDELAGPVLELGALAFTNPDALALYLLEGERSEYDTERWDALLRSIAGGGTVAPGGAPSPRAKFPAASCYPDPADRPARRDWRYYL